jgi:hypothetical protein
MLIRFYQHDIDLKSLVIKTIEQPFLLIDVEVQLENTKMLDSFLQLLKFQCHSKDKKDS